MVQRELYMEKFRRLINKDIVKVLVGIRRCGKSYMLNLLVNELKNNFSVPKENIVLINFESSKYRSIRNNIDLENYVNRISQDLEGKIYLLFDEIQEIESWEKSINSFLIDYDCDIYITGSNSKLLSGELATYLTGRYIEIKIYPFSFMEFFEYKLDTSDEKFIDKDALFNDYLNHGGMPFTLQLDEEEDVYQYLLDTYNSILYKDLLKRYPINNPDLIERLLEYIMSNVGNILSANNITNYLKHEKITTSNKTISNYLRYLENSSLIHKVRQENIKTKKLLSVNEKYYITDQGFIKAIMGINDKNYGHILENIVFMELLRCGYDVYVGRSNTNEVDFVARKNQTQIYVQVSYYMNTKETIEREFKLLENIKDNYPKYIVTMDKIDYSRNGIKHFNIIDFLMSLLKISHDE